MSFAVTAITVGMGTMAAVGSIQASKAQNAAAKMEEDQAKRRYALQSGIAQNQLEEQDNAAIEQMTAISREFMKARGSMAAMMGESDTGGNTQRRLNLALRREESETKGALAKDINTNKINIATGLLADKIDTEAIMQNARAKRISSATMAMNAITAGVSGAGSAASAGTSIKSFYKP